MALYELRRRLKPAQAAQLPLALPGQPVPEAGADREPVRGVGLEDEEGIGHRSDCRGVVAPAS